MVWIRCCRVRIWDIFQWLLLFLCGFLTRNLLDLTSINSLQKECTPCTSNTNCDELLPHDIHVQLREPFKPKTMQDVITYDYFNTSSLMKISMDDPRTGLLGPQKSDIKDALHQALILHNTGRRSQWRLKNLINGYRRYDPLRGEEYIFDLELVRDEEDVKSHQEAYRLQIVKPYGPAQLVSETLIDRNDRLVHVIVPVAVSNPRLKDFLKNFEHLCNVFREDIYLLLVLFVNRTNGSQAKIASVKEYTSSISRRFHNAHISLLQTRKQYSRSLGIDLGVKQLPHASLMFFSSVEVNISPSFLVRCRQNTQLNRQVYYPIVFSQYDPKIIQAYSKKDDYKDLFNINKHTGHWAHYRFDMACMYAEDYRSVGGLNLQLTGWGREDIDLYKKYIQNSLQIVRAPDPGLILLYNVKLCRMSLSADQFRMCQESQAECRGSRQQLANALLDHWNKN